MTRYSEKQNEEFSKFLKESESWTDKTLFENTCRYIWLSAYANNNPVSNYHRMGDHCYKVCSERDMEILYDIAWHYEAEENFTREPEFDETGAWINREGIIESLKDFKANKLRRISSY